MRQALTRRKLRTMKRLDNWIGNGRIIAEEVLDGTLRTTDRIRKRMNPSPVKTALLTAGATVAAAGLAFVGYKTYQRVTHDPLVEDYDDDFDEEVHEADEEAQQEPAIH